MSVAANIAFGLREAKVAQNRRFKAARPTKALELVKLTSLGHAKTASAVGRPAAACGAGPRQSAAPQGAAASTNRYRPATKNCANNTQFELMRLQAGSSAITFVMVTHDQDEAMAMSTSRRHGPWARRRDRHAARDLRNVRKAVSSVAEFHRRANILEAETRRRGSTAPARLGIIALAGTFDRGHGV